jgi:hypothetical protein
MTIIDVPGERRLSPLHDEQLQRQQQEKALFAFGSGAGDGRLARRLGERPRKEDEQ